MISPNEVTVPLTEASTFLVSTPTSMPTPTPTVPAPEIAPATPHMVVLLAAKTLTVNGLLRSASEVLSPASTVAFSPIVALTVSFRIDSVPDPETETCPAPSPTAAKMRTAWSETALTNTPRRLIKVQEPAVAMSAPKVWITAFLPLPFTLTFSPIEEITALFEINVEFDKPTAAVPAPPATPATRIAEVLSSAWILTLSSAVREA